MEFNKVTWYSKLLALAMLVVLPMIAFCIGRQYGEADATARFYEARLGSH